MKHSHLQKECVNAIIYYLHNCEHTGSVLLCVCLKVRATKLDLTAVLAARRKPWTNMAEKNCECAAPAIMYHVIYENFRPLTDFSEHHQIVKNEKDFGKVTACYSHVIEPWQQLHVSISANRIVDFVILVHAIIDYSLRRGPYSIQSNTCTFPFSHGLKCAAERSSLYLEVVPLHIPTQG